MSAGSDFSDFSVAAAAPPAVVAPGGVVDDEGFVDDSSNPTAQAGEGEAVGGPHFDQLGNADDCDADYLRP